MKYRQSEFVRIANRLQQEQAAARTIVDEVRRNPAAYLLSPPPEEWKTAGMVQELTEMANATHQQSPEKSAALAELATIIAASLDESYPRVLRAQFGAAAWKELATALGYRSSYEAALRALDRADEQIAGEQALAYDRAVLALARATTLRELNRSPEALALLDPAVRVFSDHGDSGRVAQCELLAGMIHHRQRALPFARESYRTAAAKARSAGDVRTVASAYINLGVLDAELGNVNDALDALQQARAIFIELGADAEVARASWGVGLALLTAGKFEAAIPVLQEARFAFRALRMPEEAGLAGVELVEAHLALERQAVARDVLLAVIEEFREARLNERALVALAYLRDLGPAALPATAHHVHSYLFRLRSEPTLLFLPPE